MRILTIAATPFFSDRGCHIRIYNEAKYLQKLGNDIKICTYHNGKSIDELDIARIGNVSWYKKSSPGFAWGKIWLDFKLLFLCIKEIRNFKPKIIHAHLYEGLAIGFLAKCLLFRRIPIILDLQGDIKDELNSYNKKNKIINKIIAWVATSIINKADFVIISSENALKSVEKIYKNKKKVEVVKDGVDIDIFSKISIPTEGVCQELNEIRKQAKGKYILIYAGGLSDSKGVGDLLNEFIKNKEIKNNWFLILFGKGEDCDKYKKMVGNNEIVFFTKNTGYFSLPHYLKLADAAIDPKNNSTESSGKIVLYMASGLPIVCFDNNFNKFRLGNSGFYVKTFSDLISALSKIKRNFFISKKNLCYEFEKESEEKEVYKIEKIIREILKNKNK
jgi:glycosyltransferase involved in cell wall biosynthesis